MNKKDVFLQYFQLGFVTNCNFFSCFNATPSVIRGICVLCNLLFLFTYKPIINQLKI